VCHLVCTATHRAHQLSCEQDDSPCVEVRWLIPSQSSLLPTVCGAAERYVVSHLAHCIYTLYTLLSCSCYSTPAVASASCSDSHCQMAAVTPCSTAYAHQSLVLRTTDSHLGTVLFDCYAEALRVVAVNSVLECCEVVFVCCVVLCTCS
jgi:hypothetical protein